ncbi:MAG: hypothetical protein KF681_08200 [Bdellovibrionaceae bacterium]|nr:hypothetical protein [Pseudobdellovibrionaceae bacterium]
MKLNKFLWDMYLESSKGKQWLEFFANLEERHAKHDVSLQEFTSSWAYEGTLHPSNYDVKTVIESVSDAIRELRQCEKDKLIPSSVDSWPEAEAYFQGVDTLCPDEDEEASLFEVDDIKTLSAALYCMYPKFFFPYYFYPNFYALEKIFGEFGIFLPPVPPKSDYDARFFYYLEICKSLFNFWVSLDLETEHLPVFLYGFAPEVVDLKFPEISNLPEPNRAWFVGGGISNNGDFEFLDNIDERTRTFWQGSKETSVGDIIVMYCLSPRSRIHSIWRAVRPGGVEPFRGFYNTVWMGLPQLVEPITLRELKSDLLFSQFPLVRSNMHGVNGKPIAKKYYDRLLILLESKGMDISALPRLSDKEIANTRIRTERDVEIQILEPLLNELGFKKSDWRRQVKLRVGRKDKVIPDYLINAKDNSREKSITADWVWEAKMSIITNDQLQKDFGQVCSYARLVNANGVGLLSKEGIWLCTKKDGFSFKKVKHWPATRAFESDSLNEIRSIAGRGKVANCLK